VPRTKRASVGRKRDTPSSCATSTCSAPSISSTSSVYPEIQSNSTRIELELRGELNRKDFGPTWNQALETGGALLGNKVKIALDISAVSSEAATPWPG
jgi:hypothetical protein